MISQSVQWNKCIGFDGEGGRVHIQFPINNNAMKCVWC